jgi:hypothetical protein
MHLTLITVWSELLVLPTIIALVRSCSGEWPFLSHPSNLNVSLHYVLVAERGISG